ncbi:sll0787 family AIR synthase-like protein [Solimonas marina]|uniref:Sll0787 family AIR synthase-like protein n=1 Tax=Solimonas marina TaxID=2714601 RepID=A0A969WAP7_9GAMM|nr:sll0787 family AIR synthase-like protein [Solimonas marina]NKF23053.1 sll0787 family AIR synthase-like protein [Solimonas marina]
MSTLASLIEGLHASRGVAHKQDIADVVATLGIADPQAAIAVGDDCAAIRDGDGWLLLAIEGFLNEFVAAEPYFAGWCGVMVNLSDIYAMGGRPIAVVDALWSAGAARGRTVLEGLADAGRIYGVPVVGGHSNAHCDREQLSVAVLGRARALLTSFDAQPGDVLLAAVDLRGGYRAHFSNWDASSAAPAPRLRGDLELLPQLAEAGLCRAAKDISQAGVLGTLLMLLECSGVGAVVDVGAVPMPDGVERARWLLQTFPSYGFLLSVRAADVAAVQARFAARGIACAAIGRVDASPRLTLRDASEERTAWDFSAQTLLGCGPSAATPYRSLHA